METYIQKLREYVRENKITFERDSLQPCLNALAFEDSDALMTEIGALGAEYERLAFIAGLRLGAQLMLEVQSTVE